MSEDQKLSGKNLQIVQEAHAKLQSIALKKNEPIAIVGMSCRFPGAPDLNKFWQILIDNKDAIGTVSDEHWDINKYYDDKSDIENKISSPYAGCLEDIYDFDSGYFDISPKEAMSLDPQQRLLLESAVEALENANQPIDALSKVSTSVYVAISSFDYGVRLQQNQKTIDAYLGTGTLLSPASGRISYSLNLNGPSMVIDTACSSALVAIHQSIASLRNQESDISLVGGVGLLLEPNLSMSFSKSKMLAPDGRCKTFDAKADGYVRSEGCAVIVIKRLSDAIKNKDHILAIIRGSAVNQDGASGGLTIPNGLAQENVIKQALKNSIIKPEEIDYVEAHGTGTSLGDPIELNSLGSVFKNKTPNLKIGSVKTNIGHLEAVSGLASLIKVVLSLQNKIIPASLYFTNPNPNVAWDKLPITVVSKNTEWAKGDKDRIAGISAFGFSGTNAHIIISEPPVTQLMKDDQFLERNHILTLSAKNDKSLSGYIKKIHSFINNTDYKISDICFTSNVGRTHYKNRLSLVVSDIEELKQKIGLFISTGKLEQGMCLSSQDDIALKIAFIFPKENIVDSKALYKYFQHYEYFSKIVNDCQKIAIENNYVDVANWSLFISNDLHSSRLTEQHLLIFSVEYALAMYLINFGIMPKIVIGYGLGESVAACIAGAISLEDALLLVYNRAILLEQKLNSKSDYTNDAFFFLQKINFKSLKIQFFGNTLFKILPNTLEYWIKHFTDPIVDVSAICLNKINQNNDILGICSNENFLNTLTDKEVFSKLLPVVTGQNNNQNKLPHIIAFLYSCMVKIDWMDYHKDSKAYKIPLPQYSWNRETYMINNQTKIRTTDSKSNTNYPLVQRKVLSPILQNQKMIFECQIDLDNFGYMKDHVIFNKIVFSESSYIEMLFETAHSIRNDRLSSKYDFIIENIILSQSCIFSETEHAVTMQVVVNQTSNTMYDVEIASLDNMKKNTWVTHINAQLSFIEDQIIEPKSLNLRYLKTQHKEEIKPEGLYQNFIKSGVNYGPNFRSVEEAYVSSSRDSVLGSIRLTCNVNKRDNYCMHPVMIDGCLQLLSLIQDNIDDSSLTYFIMGIQSIHYFAASKDKIWCQIRKISSSQSDEFPIFDMEFFDEDGTLLFNINRLQINRAGQEAFLANQTNKWFYDISWEKTDQQVVPHRAEIALKQAADNNTSWLILADRNGLGAQIEGLLNGVNQNYINVIIGKNFLKNSPKDYQINPNSLDDFKKLFEELDKDRINIRKIIHLWGIDTKLNDNIMETSLELCTSLLYLIQGLIKSESYKASISRLCVVTTNAQPVNNCLAPEQSALCGMGRVIVLEHPELNTLFVDFDKIADNTADILLSEMLFTKDENQLAFKKNERYISRLKYNNILSREKSFAANADGAYLITGGFGALGLQVANYLVDHGAKHLILISRSGASTPKSKQAVKNLENKGVTVQAVILDISQPVDMHGILNVGIPLRGVVHAAGVLDDGVLLEQNRERFAKVMKPKVQGLWNLHCLTKDLSLDFFVCFSSMTSVIGAISQINYAAANRFMDAFCCYRSSLGLPAIGLSWGPWSGSGMGANEALERRWNSMGMYSIPLKQGIEIFGKLLSSSVNHIGIMPTDWLKYPDQDRFFEHLRDKFNVRNEQQKTILDDLKKIDQSQQRKFLKKHVESLICQILSYEDGRSFEENQGFFELGMNSLTSIEFRNKLQKSLNSQLSSTITFDYPTIKKLTDYLYQEIILENQQEPEKDQNNVALNSTDTTAEQLSKQLGINWD